MTRHPVLTIGFALLLMGTLIGSGLAPVEPATGIPIAPIGGGGDNTSGSNNTTTDSETDFKDPSQIADDHPSNYTEPADLVDDPLFTPSSNNSTNASGGDERWSKGVEVKDDCSGNWWNPADYACQARDGFLETIYRAVLDVLQWSMEGVYALLFATPAPKDSEGNPAILETASNWPWKTIYTTWFPYARMAGGALWALMMLGLLATDTFLPVSVERDYQLRQLRHRLLLAFPLIVLAPTVGSLFLNFIDALVHLVRPSGVLAAGSIQRFFSQTSAMVLAGLLAWLFESILFLVMIIILLIRWALMLVFGAFLPILLPLALIDIGPIKYITEPIRGMFSMFTTFALMPVPMGMSITVGTLVVQAYEQTAVNEVMWSTVLMPFAGPGAATLAVAIPALILVAFWTLAAIMPFLTFYWKGRAIHGFVSRLLAGASIPDIESSVQDAKVDHGVGRFRSDDLLEGSPFQREAEFDSRFGGALESSWIARPSAPDRPALEGVNLPIVASRNLPDSAVDAEETLASSLDPENPLPKVRQAARRGKDVTEVVRYTDLPDKKYTVGVIHDSGGFTPFQTGRGHVTKDTLIGNNKYQKYKESKKDNDDLVVVKDPDTDDYYSLDRMMSSDRDPAAEASARRTQDQFNDLDERERRRGDHDE